MQRLSELPAGVSDTLDKNQKLRKHAAVRGDCGIMTYKLDKAMLEICGNCGRRYGRHYQQFCELNRPCTIFKPTGHYKPLDYFRLEVLKAKRRNHENIRNHRI